MIKVEEFTKAIRALSNFLSEPTDVEEAISLFSCLDIDQDGCVTEQEFMQTCLENEILKELMQEIINVYPVTLMKELPVPSTK